MICMVYIISWDEMAMRGEHVNGYYQLKVWHVGPAIFALSIAINVYATCMFKLCPCYSVWLTYA
jgi:uncharacterized membrane protein YpjA